MIEAATGQASGIDFAEKAKSLYVDGLLTVRDIARLTKKKEGEVRDALRSLHVAVRPRGCPKSKGAPPPPKSCPTCGQSFLKKPSFTKKQWDKVRFCSSKCRAAASSEAARTTWPDGETIRAMHFDEGLRFSEIGKRFGVSVSCVHRWFKGLGVAARPIGNSLANRGGEYPDAETLRRMIKVDRLPMTEIAGRYGVDSGTVAAWIDKAGLSRPTVSESRLRHKVLPDAETLSAMYERGLGAAPIAARYGVCEATILARLRQYGLTVRPSGPNGCRYFAESGLEVQSSYEITVADWLDHQGIPFAYEPKLPWAGRHRGDFLANGWYIEVWGLIGFANYNAKMANKKANYAKSGLPLIELFPWNFYPDRVAGLVAKLSQCLAPPLF